MIEQVEKQIEQLRRDVDGLAVAREPICRSIDCEFGEAVRGGQRRLFYRPWVNDE